MFDWFKKLGEWTVAQIAPLFEMSAFELLILIPISLAPVVLLFWWLGFFKISKKAQG